MSTSSQKRQSRGGSSPSQPPVPPPPPAGSTHPPPVAGATVPSIESPDRSASASASTSRPIISQPSRSSSTLFRVPPPPRSAGGDSRTEPSAKVAIPRLKRSADAVAEGSTHSGSRHRVNHACEPCRHRKTKCSGERPVCRHCQDFKISCFYADGKRDRVKKQFGSMTEKVAEYETLLKDLLNRVGDADARAIRTALNKDTVSEVGSVDPDQDTTLSAEGDLASMSGAESEASAGKGSTGALDRTEEDFTREGARQTGFMGKNSEVTWMQRLRQENAYGTPTSPEEEADFVRRTGGASSLGAAHREGATPLPEFEEGFSIQDSSYHLDDLAISTFEAVEPYEMPTMETANRLFNAYMQRVHPSFPIVGRITLAAQFQKFSQGQITNPPAQWLAIINLIFAIAAKYSHLIQADWQADERDHLIYFSRARILGMNGDTVLNHPDLQTIQTSGLMSFYLICTGQLNRSWTLCGMAIRAATALGLNVRNESSKLADHLKEIRYRVWWSLYTLEHYLCSMTGRVNCIMDDLCTVPLPLPMDEEFFQTEDAKILLKTDKQQHDRNPTKSRTPGSVQSNTPSTDRSRSQSKRDISRSPSSQQTDLNWAKNAPPSNALYFLHLVQLTRVSQDIFHRLYNPTAITGSWADIQRMISELEESVEAWFRELPPVFDFKRKLREREFYECRLSLGFFYYGTRITITRPCLCRLDRKIPHQSSKSLNFNRTAAASCVGAAKDMLNLIPDVPNATGLNSAGPWWSILHWLVQAAVVLMLELTFRAHHMPEEAENIFESAKKAIRWMHQMGEESFSARRAWLLCHTMLKEAAAKIGREVTDMPEHAPGSRRSHSSHGPSEMEVTSDSSTGPFPSSFPAAMYASVSGGPISSAYPTFNPLLQYDQYLSTAQQTAYDQADQAEMEFMSNAYHDDQGHQQPPHSRPDDPGSLPPPGRYN